MGSTLAVAIGLVAALLAIVGIVLATVANRRWARRNRRPGVEPMATDPTADPATAGFTVSRAEVADLRSALSAQAERLAQLESRLATQESQLALQGDRMAQTESQLAYLEPLLAEHASLLAAQGEDLVEQRQALPALVTHAQAITDLREQVIALGDLQEQVITLSTEVAAMASASRELVGGAAALGSAMRTSLRHVAIVRYDAFADVGGRLSYSTAILDDTATGLVITALAGKSDIRTYVKAVSGGVGQPALTPEEEQAVKAASAGLEDQ